MISPLPATRLKWNLPLSPFFSTYLPLIVPPDRAAPILTAVYVRNRLYSAGTKLTANLGGDTAALGPARHLRGHHLHDLPHRGHADRSGLGDGRRHQRGQLIVGQLGGKVGGQHLALRPLCLGLLGPAGRRERVGRLAALLRLPGEHLDDLLVRELVHGVARHLLVGDRGERHPQRAQPHLVPRPHRVGQVGPKLFLEFVHGPILPYTECGSMNTGRACRKAWHHGEVRVRTITSIAAVAGAAAIGYASVIERNWFALREETIPVLPSGADPLRVLHISDI